MGRNTFFLSSLGLNNLVTFPTRMNAQLDGIFVNCESLFHVKKAAPISSSDHCSLILCPKVYGKASQMSAVRRRSKQIVRRHDCSKENRLRLQCMVDSTDFSLFSNSDPSIFCDTLTDYLNFCFDICCPLETIYIDTDRFSSALLKRLRRRKETAYKAGLKNVVKQLSKRIHVEVQRMNSLYIDTLLGNKTCRDMWKVLQRLTKRSHKVEIDVETANQEFSSPDPNIVLPDPLPPNSPSFFVDENTVYHLLSAINTNKSSGPDKLSPFILKHCAFSLSSPICDLFNLCITSGKIPDLWRVARITPVPKSNSGKFRPIACTSILLKCFENIILKEIKPLINLNDPSQFAFRTGYSTVDAVASVVHYIAHELDKKGGLVRLLFLDYANAFGSLNRGVLLDGLMKAGLDVTHFNILRDYFSNRSQFTYANGSSSSRLAVNTGVLQGAILSPFLFSCYIDKLPIPTSLMSAK